jgi:hypothetical protein
VPFPFVVNGQTLPQGRYEVRIDEGAQGIVMIDGITNARAHAMVSTIPEYGRSPAHEMPALTFVRTEDGYRLSTIWENGEYGRDLVAR